MQTGNATESDMSKDLYIGLMTGTSIDAVDAVVARFGEQPEILASSATALPQGLRHRLQRIVAAPSTVDLDELGHSGRDLARAYTDAVNAVLAAAGLDQESVTAIGCHGQTVRHQPHGASGFTLQIGDAAALAVATGIPVVSDFRSADVALGGQGAPLVPAFHRYAFGSAGNMRAVVNIGGIANISVLPGDDSVSGYDIGPGNTLLDTWCEQHLGKTFDDGGKWAATADPDETLLDMLLADKYFRAAAPKSTGREYFNAAWLQRHLNSLSAEPKPVIIQATLAELTARTIASAVSDHQASELFLCGGGAANHYLCQRIAAALPGCNIETTAALGIAPDWVEAAAFAWLARARLREEAASVPAVTGAARAAILGAIYLP